MRKDQVKRVSDAELELYNACKRSNPRTPDQIEKIKRASSVLTAVRRTSSDDELAAGYEDSKRRR